MTFISFIFTVAILYNGPPELADVPQPSK